MFQLITSLSFSNSQPIRFPLLFDSGNFIISVFSGRRANNDWKLAGYISEISTVEGLGEVRGRKIEVGFEPKLLRFSPSRVPFELEFEPLYWINDLSVSLWEDRQMEDFRGEKGDRGLPGEKGDRGDPGAKGDRGEKGEPGSAGLARYPYVITQNNYEYTSAVGSFADLSSDEPSTGAATQYSPVWIQASFDKIRLLGSVVIGAGEVISFGATASFIEGALLQYTQNNVYWETLATLSGFTNSNIGQFKRYDLCVMARGLRIWRSEAPSYLGITKFRID